MRIRLAVPLLAILPFLGGCGEGSTSSGNSAVPESSSPTSDAGDHSSTSLVSSPTRVEQFTEMLGLPSRVVYFVDIENGRDWAYFEALRLITSGATASPGATVNASNDTSLTYCLNLWPDVCHTAEFDGQDLRVDGSLWTNGDIDLVAGSGATAVEGFDAVCSDSGQVEAIASITGLLSPVTGVAFDGGSADFSPFNDGVSSGVRLNLRWELGPTAPTVRLDLADGSTEVLTLAGSC